MPATLRIRRDKLAEHMAAAGMSQQKHLADAMGMSEPSVHRILKEREIQGRTLARILAALPDATFDDLFEIVDETEARSRIRRPFVTLLRAAEAGETAAFTPAASNHAPITQYLW